ncbi:folate-binding protein YgfZ [Mariprofundus ferrooxydans]|nr:folate-binding protein YgfZ [Mariprofundus ferrooxydans]
MSNTSLPLPTLSSAAVERLKKSYIIAKNARWSVLKASGSDIRSYLQGQITQDIDKLSGQQAIHSCLLSPQGKAVSELFIIAGHNDELIILTPSSHAEATVARLRQFALGHQLRIGIVDTLAVYSLHGSQSHDGLHQLALKPPQGNWLACDAKADDDTYALLMRSDTQSYWLIGNSQRIESAIPDTHRASTTELEALRISQGKPVFGIEWDESLHPLNANLVEFNGVDFNKGCYVGQEVTSRMHWRGGIKKKLYRVKLDAIPTALPCPIHSTAKIGELKSAALDEQGQCFGIALLPIEVAESETSLTLENNTTITILEACHA